MPTIDQLQAVVVAADDDSIPVSQGGIVRRVSRAQFLAGTQAELALVPGLLGRSSPGLGPPEHVGIGGGLSLANGVLSSPPTFSVAALPQNTTAATTDLVGIWQAGRDMAVPVGTLLATPGVDVSGQVVRGSSGNARKLGDWVSDGAYVEAFGAVGDGVTDDSAAFARALVSGQAIRLGPKTYRVDGQWTISVAAVLLGVPGVSTIRRVQQSGGAWISIAGPSFTAVGIAFDAGGLVVDGWAVQVGSACTATRFEQCSFYGASGPTLGNGLTIQARDGVSGAPSAHRIRDCTFRNNAVHGVWIQAAAGAVVENCAAFQNGAYGICLDFNDPTFQQVVRHCSVLGCRSWSNERGISVGNYNESNLEPPIWGPANPDAQYVLVADNVCFDNTAYGIAASGQGLQVSNNVVSISAGSSPASAFLFNCSGSSLRHNSATGTGPFGIDAGGCVDCEVSANLVEGFGVGINAGGGIRVRVLSNKLIDNTRSITVFQVETDGAGNNFGMACDDLQIHDNAIVLEAGGSGIMLFDGPQGVSICDNHFTSSDTTALARAVLAHSDRVVVARNRWDGEIALAADVVVMAGMSVLRAPEIADEILVPATASVAGLVGQHQYDVSGQVSFVRVTAGGGSYTTARVIITGSGTGAQATAYIRAGAIIGVALIGGGSGYGAADTQVTITGDGLGATAVAFVGLPIPEGRRVVLSCGSAVQLQVGGSVGSFDSWMGNSVSVPARSEVACVGASGRWRTVAFFALDYLCPAADGGVSLRSVQGDVTIQPRGAGFLRVISDSESVGFVTSMGRGSPEGVVAAPPGSDYRNLNGGAGQSLWLKQSGTGNTGWSAIG